MPGSRHLRVPVGHDAERWSTLRSEKTLVVAARTVTSTARVLECLPPLLRGDRRVSVVFAYDPTSAFNDGVLDLLHDSGCRVMPWDQLAHIAPDLILSASENIDVPEGSCPVLVLPHGVGFQKLVPDSRSPHRRLSGAAPDSLLETGRAWLALSHPGQEEQLLVSHPKAAGRTLLVGDASFDELRIGLRHVAAFRRALGVADGQRLVVLSSTWGPTSLLGQAPDLPERLLAELPYDEYRVAAIFHPNVWSAHGAWQIRALQAAALEAGLIVAPPVHAWQSVLLAASVVIGDHGSVTLYGASLDKPVLLGAFGADAVAGTAIDALGASAPRLDLRGRLLPQIEEVVRSHAPRRYAAVREQAFAEPGQALSRLRAALYHLMKLPEPPTASPRSLTPRKFEQAPAPVTSWLVTTAVEPAESGGTDATVLVRRSPAAVCDDVTETTDTFIHLSCDDEERDAQLMESASVLIHHGPMASSVSALQWARDTLNRFPGSLLTAAAVRGGGCLVGLRDGRAVEATSTGQLTDPCLLAATVYTCLRAGMPLDDSIVTLRLGDLREEDVALRLRPGWNAGCR
ncbi:hypothetical protein AB0I98_07645 [Streptomyces sp. NPDC050211]|uniref:hypothetical protein n=1 Tax=Streptomyces sp. NPDC050211 TaxID=3154932 RepID=UPI0034428034